jgi:hypothetical protein
VSDQRYVSFVPQENNVNDPISAEDINELQRAIISAQGQDFKQGDTDFTTQALFALENHTICNSMIIDIFNNNSMINVSQSTVRYAVDMLAIILDTPGSANGIFLTKLIANGSGKPFRKFVLIVDEYKPTGTNITYELSQDGLTYYPIVPNANPITFEEGVEFILRATLSRTDLTVNPRLDGWAILYQDESYMFQFLDDGLDIPVEGGWDGTIVD